MFEFVKIFTFILFIFILINYDIITVQLQLDLGQISKTLNLFLLLFFERSWFENHAKNNGARAITTVKGKK